MAIPARILDAAKNLLRLPASNTAFDGRIQQGYEQALLELTRSTDLFSAEVQIAAVADQSMYATPTGVTRILGVAHNQQQLPLVPSRSMDLLTEWQVGRSGTPEVWVYDKLPPGIDFGLETSPLQFVVHPAPEISATGVAGFIVTVIRPPTNDAPPMWLEPYLIYTTVAAFSNDSTEERDVEAATFWSALADVWKELILAKFG